MIASGRGSGRGPRATRLDRILDKIAELSADPPGSDLRSETAQMHELAAFLSELYGPDAVTMARRLEQRSKGRPFARLVRVTVEWLEREEQRRQPPV